MRPGRRQGGIRRFDRTDGDARGRTVVERRGRAGPANAVLLDRLDADGFFALLTERLARL